MLLAAGLLGCTKSASIEADGSLPLDTIRLPPGFSISLYARVPEARSMALGARGTVFVGSVGQGKVHAVPDRDGDGKADATILVDSGLNLPNGVAFREGALYVGALDRVLRYDAIEEHLGERQRPVVLNDSLPADGWHGARFIGFGPDGRLYVPVGAPCNVCEPPGPYAAIHRMRPDGSGLEPVALGVRNSVGFDWHPVTKELWFTDNGRDNLGDDLPPDELNRAPERGLHFGFPYCHGTTIADPEYGAKRPCAELARPARELGPHVAALGMRFYTGAMFPEPYRQQIFIAEHGSWNRSRPIGYRVSVAFTDGKRVTDYRIFAEGWLRDGKAWGRPVDVLVMPDGTLLVSDDQAGAIYRIRYDGKRAGG